MNIAIEIGNEMWWYTIDGMDFLLLIAVMALIIAAKTIIEVNRDRKKDNELKDSVDELFERLERNMKL
jgi:hypothetical protein